MRYIVIGGAGFIGSHLCEELSKEHEVISIDDYSAGYASNLDNLNVQQVKWDIVDGVGLLYILKKLGKIDGIFNQAASKKNVCLNNPARDLDVNIKGAFNVANCAKELKCKLVHASTGSVYGEAIGLQDENHPTNPVSYYGISKLAGEKYARFIANATILRYFHVYGSRQESKDDRGGVLSIWMRRISEGKPIILYGDGTQERSFTYVKDVVKANIAAIERGNGIYNVASGYVYQLIDMIEELRKIYPNIDVTKRAWQIGDVKKFHVDNTNINILMKRNYFEWVRLSDGIKNMLIFD